MRESVIVSEADESGRPLACIPGEQVWELVEFLSYARVRVSYTYDERGFTVRFLFADQPTAQRILDDWATMTEAEALLEA